MQRDNIDNDTAVSQLSDAPLYLRVQAVTRRYDCSRTWFLDLVAAGIMPQPRRYGARMTVWNRVELDTAFADPDLPAKVARRNEERRREDPRRAA